MMTASAKRTRSRRGWRWIFGGRPGQADAFIEEQPDGTWAVIINRIVVGIVGTRQAAEDFVASVRAAPDGRR
jgi:hypothetical protein